MNNNDNKIRWYRILYNIILLLILRVVLRPGGVSKPVGRGFLTAAAASDVVPERLEPSQQIGPKSLGFGSRWTGAGQRVEQHLGPVRWDERVLESCQVGLHAGHLVLELVVRVQVQTGLPGLLVHRDQILAVANVRHQVLLRNRCAM